MLAPTNYIDISMAERDLKFLIGLVHSNLKFAKAATGEDAAQVAERLSSIAVTLNLQLLHGQEKLFDRLCPAIDLTK